MLGELHTDAYANPADWRIMQVLSIYRLLLIALLGGLSFTSYSTVLFDQGTTLHVVHILLIYLVPAGLMQVAVSTRIPSLSRQAHLAFLLDTAAIIFLMHASRGVSGGLGVLLITPAVGCSLVLSLRMGLLNAAIGTFALFGAEAWYPSSTGSDFGAAEMTTTGLLGLMLFATAIGAGAVAARARNSEARAIRAGSELANASRLNERIVEVMDTPVIVLDEDRRIRLMNAAAKRLILSGSVTEGAAIADLLPDLHTSLLAWDANPNGEREPLNLQADGPEVTPSFTRLGYSAWAPVLVFLDDAARVREQAQQMKLASLGRLSAGIAHEIRNPLSAIKHAGQLLAESPQMAPEDRRLLDMIQRHSVRIDKIVSDVLRLSRRESASPQGLNLREFVERAIVIYREGCPNQDRPIEIEEISDSLRIRFDPNHLQQILLNLWANSFDHGARSGIAVRVRLVAGRLNPGQRPYLDVGDDGAGIPPEQQERLFEPFFTTAHHGTGLGLYLSRELCEYNQARLMYQPSDQGTQFRLVFTAG